MKYNVKVNHEDLGEFESAEKLWQAISEANLVTGDLADWEDVDDSSVPALLEAAYDQSFIGDYEMQEIPNREPLEDYLEDALEYPEHVNPVEEALTAVLTGAREFAGLKITDNQIKEYVRQYQEGADSHTGLYDGIEDKVMRAIEKVDYDKLTSWVDWVGGDDTATNLLEEEN